MSDAERRGTAVLSLVRRAVAFEVNLYRSLFRWVTRRPDVPPGAAVFPYVGAIATLLWAFVIVSAIELVAVHLLLPWATIRLVAELLGLSGLVWMLGRPLEVPLRKGPETVVAIRFHADDARGLVARVRERLGEGTRT
jgi:hypothetical protein